jgi:ammonium transporter, Amt family
MYLEIQNISPKIDGIHVTGDLRQLPYVSWNSMGLKRTCRWIVIDPLLSPSVVMVESSVYKKIFQVGLGATLLASLPMSMALAADEPVAKAQAAADLALSNADTAFMLVATALVLLMTPGLAFFYGGFVRSRNVLNTMMMSLILMGVVGVTWVLWGYSLSFAPGNKFIGGLQWLFFNNVDPAAGYYIPKDALPAGNLGAFFVDAVKGDGSYSPTIPHQLFAMFQMMFAIITPALISGAIVERTSFKVYFWFIVLWSGLFYPVLAHMVWGVGGFLGVNGGMGALDFAGGTVVHISSGVSALVAAWMIGPRKTYPNQPAAPHNVAYILLGAGLLWFGWFGFNGGSALASGGLATTAAFTTTTSASAAALMWVILEWVLRGKPTAVGIATGAVAGLVGITPGAGFVTPVSALLIGAITSTACFFAVSLKAKMQFDDSLDTFPVHGVGGTIGAILTGVFAVSKVNPIFGKTGDVPNPVGLLDGNGGQIVTQIVAVLITYVMSAVATFVIMKLLEVVFGGLRVKQEVEYQGLDISEHGEEAYGEELASGLSYSGSNK